MGNENCGIVVGDASFEGGLFVFFKSCFQPNLCVFNELCEFCVCFVPLFSSCGSFLCCHKYDSCRAFHLMSWERKARCLFSVPSSFPLGFR